MFIPKRCPRCQSLADWKQVYNPHAKTIRGIGGLCGEGITGGITCTVVKSAVMITSIPITRKAWIIIACKAESAAGKEKVNAKCDDE